MKDDIQALKDILLFFGIDDVNLEDGGSEETMTLDDIWKIIGASPERKPSRFEVITALSLMRFVCECAEEAGHE